MSNKWVHSYASGESSVTFPFPVDEDCAAWFAPTGSGTVVIVSEGGTVLTYTAVGGEVIRGKFLSLTSTTCTGLLIGNTAPPVPALATVGASAAASIDTRVTTAESVSTSAVTRFSTSVSTLTSTDTSVVTRFSTSVSTLTSADTSLTTRISVAESTEASKG